jgi:thioredoxin-related protein
MTKIILVLAILPVFAMAQDAGIHFESGLSWKEILGRAKAENKYIFVDCHTTWCGPCKWMEKNIYPETEVAEYYNEHFINVALQMDRTEDDPQSVRNWYADGDTIAERYNVKIYPTYLFFTPSGQIIHRFSGSVNNKLEFIIKGTEAFDPQKQYYSLIRACRDHKGDSLFLLHTLHRAVTESDTKSIAEVGDYYLESLQDPASRHNLVTVCALIQTCGNYKKGFDIFLNNVEKVDRIGDDLPYIRGTLAAVIFENVVKPGFLNSNTWIPIYWKKIEKYLHFKYPGLSEELVKEEDAFFRSFIEDDIKAEVNKNVSIVPDWSVLLNNYERKFPGCDIEALFLIRKAKFFARKKMWNDCADAAFEVIHKYGYKLDDNDANNIVWSFIFMHSENKKMLSAGIKKMKRIVVEGKSEEPVFIDTYANLLYKLGHPKEAFSMERKAIELQNKVISQEKIEDNREYDIQNLNLFRSNWEKMQSGAPTWESSISGS